MYLLIVAAVTLWLGLAVGSQLSFATLTRLRRWDPFGFIPSWHFFAPNPARFDTVILVRDVAGPVGETDDPQSPWSVATVVHREHWYQPIFNPQRRIQKAVHDLQNAIGNMSERYDPAAICRSAAAKALFDYAQRDVLQDGLSSRLRTRQFAIVRIENVRAAVEARVVFVTEPMTTDEQ